MIVIAALMFLFAAVLCARLLYSLAIYALPLWTGGAAAHWVWQAGSSWTSTIVAGIGCAFLALVLAQLCARSQIVGLRVVVSAMFAICAAIAGYHAAQGLAVAMLPSGFITYGLSLVSAALVGSAAALRILHWGDAASKA